VDGPAEVYAKRQTSFVDDAVVLRRLITDRLGRAAGFSVLWDTGDAGVRDTDVRIEIGRSVSGVVARSCRRQARRDGGAVRG
jgi:hypothetical protein